VVAGVLLWLAAVGLGFAWLWQHTYTPGPAAKASSGWPSLLARNETKPTLVVVLHPQCACATASVGELARIVARAAAPFEAMVLFSAEGDTTGIVDGALWRSATSIPGVTAILDRDAIEARHFGAYVSGQTFLFDRFGHLIFSGGITAGRGHAGDNDGEAAVLAALATGVAPLATTPVFGCLLHGSVSS
jgi:hypothetical protein